MIYLKSKNLNFKELETSDVNETYVKWLNDKDINKYIIQKNVTNNTESLKDYVKKHRDSKNDFLFGIFENKKNTHIGNIKLTISHPKEKIANIGILIGEKIFQGKGYGKESINTITKFGQNKLNLIRIEAGFLDTNQKSLHCFLKCGFVQDGHLKSYFIVDNKRVGRILVSIIKNG